MLQVLAELKDYERPSKHELGRLQPSYRSALEEIIKLRKQMTKKVVSLLSVWPVESCHDLPYHQQWPHTLHDELPELPR